MGECEEIPSEFLSFSSPENRDSIGSLDEGEDEEFYEKIEAPKFVDFSIPDQHISDDRYWFCHRVGCDQKHEEEMDSEAIYNNFVLRVMAARSPNVKLRKAFHRTVSRTPTRCPLSAPPKSSKPRLSRMALISSFSKKIAEEKKKMDRSTPLRKTKPVAAKYLTTPRNKKCTSDLSSFASVQHQRPANVEMVTSGTVAKALVFRSPKKSVKVKTSVELRTPVPKLCQGMSRLDFSSQRKRVLGYSSKPSKNLGSSSSRGELSSQKVQSKPEKPLRICKGREAKSGRSIKSKINRQLSEQQDSNKLLGGDEKHSLKDKESCSITKVLATKVTKESSNEEALEYPMTRAIRLSDLAPQDDAKREVKGRDGSSCANKKGNESITSESCGPADQLNETKSCERERSGNDLEDGDDKENAPASDGNSMLNSVKQNGRKISGKHDKRDQARRKAAQAQETKVKKPKATNPRPFRLRTDDRRVVKEPISDRRADPLVHQSENAKVRTPGGKLQRKHVNDIQKGSMAEVLKTPKRQERSKPEAPTALESNKCHEPKLKSSAMQRLEKFRKQSVRPQRLVSTKQKLVRLTNTPSTDATSLSLSHGCRRT